MKPKSFDDCVKWARQLFQDYYFNTISQLLYNFPPDHVRVGRRGSSDMFLDHIGPLSPYQETSNKQPFWSGPKRCPKPVVFDTTNSTHLDFIVASSVLFAQTYGIKGWCSLIRTVWHNDDLLFMAL